MQSIMSKYKLAIPLGSYFLVLLVASCSPAPEIQHFEVAVVGNGVPQQQVQNPPAQRNFPKDESKGKAIWKAAKLALDSKDFQNLKSVLRLIPYDDYGNDDRAQRIAKRIRSNPAVLAVIGHTASGTTQAAAHIYDGAGIPLLMPIATSPNVMFPPGKSHKSEYRLKRSFRLPPADDRVQAPALAWIVSQQLEAGKVYIIGDTSPGAAPYSKPLCETAGRLLDDLSTVHGLDWVDGASDDFASAARKVRGWEAEIVIFCGYTSTAKQLLQRLREEYEDVPIAERPTLIFTDGVLDEAIEAEGFRALLTFPLPTLKSLEDRSEAQQLKKLLGKTEIESYEIYAYDAMVILRQAVHRCQSDPRAVVGRACVSRELANIQGLRGVAFSYTFLGGENIESSYHVYEYVNSSDEEVRGRFTYQRILTSNDLSEITGGR